LAPADLHARDPANRPANEGYNHNIFENQGGGLEIVVQDTQGRWQAIARFEREPNPENFATPYREVSLAGVSTGAAWHQSLHRARGRGLYVVGNELVYRIGGRSDSQLTTFGVRLPSDEDTIRPGDDFLLRLGLGGSDDKSEGAAEPGITGTALVEDFVAVYDKKMLWRANLYIDERESSGLDWNEANRWMYGNDWNKGYGGEDALDVVDNQPLNRPRQQSGEPSFLAGLSDGNGGQVVRFPRWTPVRGPQEREISAVAYDYPYSWAGKIIDVSSPTGALIDNPYRYDQFLGTDSPFDFVNKLVLLRLQMNAVGNAYGQLYGQAESDTEYAPGVSFQALAKWEGTHAPGQPESQWLNYLNYSHYLDGTDGAVDMAALYETAGIERVFVPQMGLFYYARKIPVEAVYGSTSRTPALNRAGPAENGYGLEERWGVAGAVVGRVEDQKYVLSPSTSGATGEVHTRYNRPVELWGAGTDCVGFAQQAATYRGHPYRWVSLGRRDLEPIAETEPVYRAFPRIETDPGGDGKTYSDAIVTREDVFNASDDEEISLLLSRIRPGDIMYYAPGHIAIVRQVVTNEEGVVDDLSDVLLIESVYGISSGQRFAHVYAERSLEDVQTLLSDRQVGWRVVRLRI